MSNATVTVVQKVLTAADRAALGLPPLSPEVQAAINAVSVPQDPRERLKAARDAFEAIEQEQKLLANRADVLLNLEDEAQSIIDERAHITARLAELATEEAGLNIKARNARGTTTTDPADLTRRFQAALAELEAAEDAVADAYDPRPPALPASTTDASAPPAGPSSLTPNT